MGIGQPRGVEGAALGNGLHKLATINNTCTYYYAVATRKCIQAGSGNSQLEFGSLRERHSRGYDQNMVCQGVIATYVVVEVLSLVDVLKSFFDTLEWNQRNLPLEKSQELTRVLSA